MDRLRVPGLRPAALRPLAEEGGRIERTQPGVVHHAVGHAVLGIARRAPDNSLENRLVANHRLRFIHRPGSGFYLVFNEESGNPTRTADPGSPLDETRSLLGRGFAVKLSYLVRF